MQPMKPDNHRYLHQPPIIIEGVNVEDLKRRIWHDTMLLNLAMEQNKVKNVPSQLTNEQAKHDFMLGHMQKMMQVCKAKGFVFGIISEDGKPVSGSSENLHGWWKERVRFDETAPEAISDYNVKKVFGGIMEGSLISTPHILKKLHDTTLACLLSSLIQYCDPPQRQFPLEKGVAPPWWPTGDEVWLSELDVDKEKFPPPYRKPHHLKKAMKICVLMAVFRHMYPNVDKIHSVLMHSKRLQDKITAKEAAIIADAVKHEEARLTSSLKRKQAYDENQPQNKKQNVMLQRNIAYPASKHALVIDDDVNPVKFHAGQGTNEHQMTGSSYQPLFSLSVVNQDAISFKPLTAPLVNQVARSSNGGVSQIGVAESGLQTVNNHENTINVNSGVFDVIGDSRNQNLPIQLKNDLVEFLFNVDDPSL